MIAEQTRPAMRIEEKENLRLVDPNVFTGLKESDKRFFFKTRYSKGFLAVDLIKKVVCEHFDIRMDEIEGNSRKREIVNARQISIHFLLKRTNLTLKQIGKLFGKMHHSTVIYARETVSDLCDSDKNYRQIIKEIGEKLDDFVPETIEIQEKKKAKNF